MEALSPRSANIPSKAKPDFPKTASTKRPSAQKPPPPRNHAPPPPSYVHEPGRNGQQYETGAFLGKGGFAICYEGKLLRSNRVFAMKVVKSEMQQKKMEEKFRTELQIHSKMRHPNIVSFYRAFAHEANTYVILELCPNGSVMDMVKKRQCLTLPEVRRFMVQLCGAIKYLHKRNVAHRDLKMGNLFLDHNMNVKVGDFGLAAIMLSAKDERRRKTLCGTPNYIAPEVLDRSKGGHNQKVDIWSLGIIFFAMLTGFPPFQSRTQEEIYKKVRSLTYTWPKDSACANYIPAEAKDLVSACLSLQEGERPDPDQIVDHDFFNMYPGCIPRELDHECRYSIPHWIKNQDPRGDQSVPGYSLEHDPKYLTEISHMRRTSERYSICKNAFYSECGVGKSPSGEVRRPAGKRCSKSAFAECLAEEERGLQPVMPLPKNRIYSYYTENEKDWKLGETCQKKDSPEVVEEEEEEEEEEDEDEDDTGHRTRTTSLKMQAATLARTELALAAQLRQKESQPKSHAALLRQQALPSRQPPKETPRLNSQHNSQQVDKINKQDGKPLVSSARNLLGDRPIRTRGQIASAHHASLRERSGNPTAVLPKSNSTPAEMGASGTTRSNPKRRLAPTTHRNLLEGRIDDATSQSKESKPARSGYETLSARTAKLELRDTPTQRPPPQPAKIGPLQEISTTKPNRHPSKADTKPITSSGTASKLRSTIGVNPLMYPEDEPDIMPGTSVREVMTGLKIYLSAIRANQFADTQRSIRARRRQRQPQPSPHSRPHGYVVKWVDYTNRYGIGYVLDDGSVGCVFKAEHGHPASCVVVREGERHIRQKSRAKGQPDSLALYSEVDQLVPRYGCPVEFYENVGMSPSSCPDGAVKRIVVPSRVFEVKRSTSSVGGKSRSDVGIDCTRRNAEKVKRVKLVDQFGKYMIGSLGRGGDAMQATDESVKASANSKVIGEYVKFYQRLGNVGIWGFGDGAFQFNYPDHTKLVIYLTGKESGYSSDPAASCRIDFYHLSPSAARYLTARGKMHPSGFDTRAVISDTASTFLSCASGNGGQTYGISSDRFLEILETNSFREKMEFITSVFESWVRNGRLGGRVVTSLSPSSSSSTVSSSTRSATLSTLPSYSTLPTSIPSSGEDPQCGNSDMFWDGAQEKSWAGSSGGKFVWVTVGAQGGDGEYMSVVLKGSTEKGDVQCLGADGQGDLKERLMNLTL